MNKLKIILTSRTWSLISKAMKINGSLLSMLVILKKLFLIWKFKLLLLRKRSWIWFWSRSLDQINSTLLLMNWFKQFLVKNAKKELLLISSNLFKVAKLKNQFCFQVLLVSIPVSKFNKWVNKCIQNYSQLLSVALKDLILLKNLWKKLSNKELGLCLRMSI